MQIRQSNLLIGCHLHERGDMPIFEVRLQSCIDILTRLCFLVTGADFFAIVTDSLIESLQVGKYEFEVDDLDISLRIDRA